MISHSTSCEASSPSSPMKIMCQTITQSICKRKQHINIKNTIEHIHRCMEINHKCCCVPLLFVKTLLEQFSFARHISIVMCPLLVLVIVLVQVCVFLPKWHETIRNNFSYNLRLCWLSRFRHQTSLINTSYVTAFII